MDGEAQSQVEAVQEQIQKLRKIRQRWAEGHDLTAQERLKQGPTLELLDGAIEDLLTRMRNLKEKGNA